MSKNNNYDPVHNKITKYDLDVILQNYVRRHEMKAIIEVFEEFDYIELDRMQDFIYQLRRIKIHPKTVHSLFFVKYMVNMERWDMYKVANYDYDYGRDYRAVQDEFEKLFDKNRTNDNLEFQYSNFQRNNARQGTHQNQRRNKSQSPRHGCRFIIPRKINGIIFMFILIYIINTIRVVLYIKYPSNQQKNKIEMILQTEEELTRNRTEEKYRCQLYGFKYCNETKPCPRRRLFMGSLIADDSWDVIHAVAAEGYGMYHTVTFIESNTTQNGSPRKN